MQSMVEIPFPELFPASRNGRLAAAGDDYYNGMFMSDAEGDTESTEEEGPEAKPRGTPDARQQAKNKPKGSNDTNLKRK